mgnify:CR=1 FL=1
MKNCVFCDAPLSQGPPWAPGAGYRLAFDPRKGRLWEICPRCRRWNLTPLELRWESLEACEAAVREKGRVRLMTSHLTLVDVDEGELVRVGEAPRPEFVDWRYGLRLAEEARRSGFWARLLAGLPSPPVEGYDPYGIFFRGPPNPSWLASPFLDSAAGLTFLFSQVPLAPRCPSCGRPMALHPWDFQNVCFVNTGGGEEVLAPCGICGDQVTLPLREARPALRLGMGVVMPSDLLRRKASPAALELEAAGGATPFVRTLAVSRAALGELGDLARAGLLVALDEAAEAEALEAEWRRAEEIAAIVDGELTRVEGFQEFRKDVLSGEVPDAGRE